MSKNGRGEKNKKQKQLQAVASLKEPSKVNNQHLFIREKHIKIAPKHPNQGRR